MIVKSEAIFHCEPEVVFEQHFDPDGRRRREMEGCGALSVEAITNETDGPVWRQVLIITEENDAPGPVRKLMGQTVKLEEETTWEKGSAVAKVTYRTDQLRGRISTQGEIRCEALGEGKTRVTLELEVKVKIFGVGGLIEKMAAKKIPEDQKTDADWFNANIAPSLKGQSH